MFCFLLRINKYTHGYNFIKHIFQYRDIQYYTVFFTQSLFLSFLYLFHSNTLEACNWQKSEQGILGTLKLFSGTKNVDIILAKIMVLYKTKYKLLGEAKANKIDLYLFFVTSLES